MSDARQLIDLIAARRSVKADMLVEPAPSDDQLADLLQAAMSAPDHGAIRPWRFKVIRGEARHKLSDLFEDAQRKRDPAVADDVVNAMRGKPLRSPLIVAAVAEVMENHPKVPVEEQVVAAACATQNLLLAAHAAGWGAILLTGWPAFDATVKQGLGLAAKDSIIGFVYMGTPTEAPREMKRPDARNYIEDWQ